MTGLFDPRELDDWRAQLEARFAEAMRLDTQVQALLGQVQELRDDLAATLQEIARLQDARPQERAS